MIKLMHCSIAEVPWLCQVVRSVVMDVLRKSQTINSEYESSSLVSRQDHPRRMKTHILSIDEFIRHPPLTPAHRQDTAGAPVNRQSSLRFEC